MVLTCWTSKISVAKVASIKYKPTVVVNCGACRFYGGRRNGKGRGDAVHKCRHKHAQHELGGAIAQEETQQARAVLGRNGR